MGEDNLWLIAGLGNPGQKYESHRHNIGFMAVEEIVRAHDFTSEKKKFQSLLAEGRVGRCRVVALEPQTFMNLSGQAVQAAAAFYKIPPERIVVLHDELDLPPGKLRVKRGGSAGGHNGLRSIDGHIGQDYWRVRLGIGHPGDKDRVSDYVLSDFAKSDREWLEKILPAVAKEMPALLEGNPELFMTRVAEIMGPEKEKSKKAEGEVKNGI